jgi:hypothetical protein
MPEHLHMPHLDGQKHYLFDNKAEMSLYLRTNLCFSISLHIDSTLSSSDWKKYFAINYEAEGYN